MDGWGVGRLCNTDARIFREDCAIINMFTYNPDQQINRILITVQCTKNLLSGIVAEVMLFVC